MINFLTKKKVDKRERLSIMHVFLTDKATYIIYNTQTKLGKDCVNIEVERVGYKREIILEDEIFEDSWGAMGGDAFTSLVIDALNHLRKYIEQRHEKILTDARVIL